MRKSFSKIKNLSNFLFQVYLKKGRDECLREWESCAQFIGKSCENNEPEVNKRLVLMVSHFLTFFYEDQQDMVINEQLLLTERVISETDSQKKIQILIGNLHDFLINFKNQSSELAGKVIDYTKNCSMKELSELTSEILAGKFNLSPGHFSKRFKWEKGYSAHQLLLYEKLNRAFRILIDEKGKKIKISELSRQLGFAETRYFRKLFKEKFGFPPSKLK